ncbi:acetate kinase [Lentzea sp. NBRC 102530]|uniref:acetate/propionate family kinase n=1 Tax=Lentzea sp. NBRC 102530 TaxID=3032201 RepID=UPI0024A2B9EB|nr:acetate kinase [Lentzea sp. NBRC 102530]GLY47790.1 acetate kinase [Lentzea sp. NBRC 102530]
MSTVLTINPGSSSLQAEVVDASSERVLARAESEAELDDLLEHDVDAVGHRLVHGGPELLAPTVVDDSVVELVRDACSLAPLHVPVSLKLLSALRDRLPDVPHVVCPDTAFHRDLPEVAATWAVPESWRTRFRLRRYGFHGLSYAWVASRVDAPNVLAAHLGGGCSVCAIENGRSVDTSMGFTPLDGVPMAKRSGSVDPGMVLWLLEQGLTLDEVRDGLYRESGLLGLSGGLSDDTRELVASDDPKAAFALAVFAHRVSRELAATAVSLRRVDALVFTGEIGWDQPEVREAVLAGLGILGDVPVHVVKPEENLQICRETLRALR